MKIVVLVSFLLSCLIAIPGLAWADAGVGSPVNEILEITDEGLEPDNLLLPQPASSAFVYNSTSDSLITYEIDYKNKLGYCASGKSWMDKDGKLKPNAPLEPQGFRSFCFPQPGEYPVKILGLSKFPKGISTKITVGK